MKNNPHSHRPYAAHVRSALSLILIATSIGCVPNSSWDGKYRADRKERLTRGCTFYFDGAGGGTTKSNYAQGVVEGMLAAGYRGGGELVSWETDKGLMADQDASVAYKRTKAQAGAARIRNYQKDHPAAPVNLLGFSAGTAEAIFALEVLPETAQVDHVVLLGTSISRDYDLTEALKRVRNKLYIFTSTHDQMLGTLMQFSGTADRKFHDPGAGIKGFVLPAGASAATRRLYADKIVTIPYSEDFRKDKNQGRHFDNVKKEFIRDHVAPLLMGQRVSERDRSPTGASLSSGRAAALHLRKTLAQDAQGCTQDACAPHPRPPTCFLPSNTIETRLVCG